MVVEVNTNTNSEECIAVYSPLGIAVETVNKVEISQRLSPLISQEPSLSPLSCPALSTAEIVTAQDSKEIGLDWEWTGVLGETRVEGGWCTVKSAVRESRAECFQYDCAGNYDYVLYRLLTTQWNTGSSMVQVLDWYRTFARVCLWRGRTTPGPPDPDQGLVFGLGAWWLAVGGGFWKLEPW